MHRAVTCGWFALLILAGCGLERRAPAAPDRATATGSLSISPDPILTIAPTDSDGVPLLSTIADATHLPSGAIAVVDRARPSVMLFDGSGHLLGEHGRKGAGPGEFDAIGGIGRCREDTLFVWDAGNGRMSVLDADGRFVRQYPLSAEPVPGYCGVPGDLVIWSKLLNLGPPTPDAPAIRGIASLVDVDGAITGTLGELQAGENRPLGVVTLFAVSRERIYVGTGDTAAVAVYGRDGLRLGAFPVGDATQAATPQQYDAAITALVNTVPGTTEERAGVMAFMRKRFRMPKHLPTYRAILVDPSGRVYVVTSPRGVGSTEVAVFDDEGNSLGEVWMPGDLDVVEVGLDYLLGVVERDDGNGAVVVYRLGVGTP